MNNNSTSTVPFQGGEYTGPLNDQGLPHGKGSLYFPYTKHKYEGEFVNGQAHGKGVASGVLSQEMTLIVNNELRNVGDKFVSCSSSNSSGTSSSSTTTSSSSNLIDSNNNNNTWTNQWKYDGQWMNGQMHGQGEFTFANGDMYSGEWKDGVACGKGLYSWQSTGDRYMGEFVNMKRHGAGTMLFSNGHKYDGLFYNDYRHGHGIETYSNGNRFEGYWVMDKRHGPAFAYVKFENLDKKLQKKRKQGMKGQPTIPSSQVTNQANSKTSTIYLNLHSIDQYVVYSQEYHLGRLLSEKELFPCDYAPYIYTGGVSGGGLKAPTELLTQDMDSVLVQIDEEIETLVMESNSSGGSSSGGGGGYSSSGGNGSVHHHSNHHTPTITSDTIVSDDDDKNSSPTIHTSGGDGGMSNNTTTTSSNMNSPPTAMTTITSSQILNKLAKRKSQSATLNQQSSSSPPIHGHLIGTNLMTSPPSPSSHSHSTQVLSSSSASSTSSQSILTTDNVFVQGVVCWEDKYWDMIQQLFVQQFTSKCEYNYTKILLNTLDQVTTLEERRQQLMEHIDKCENAKSKTKWEMKRVIVEELHAEAPNDYSGVDLFMDRLDELMSEMRIELSDIIEMKNSASQVRDEKKIQLTKQQLSEIEKKLFRLESALQTAKNTAQPFTKIKLFMRDQVLYQQLLEEVAIHLQRLRVLLRRLMLIRYDVHNISVNVDSNSTTVTLNKEQLEAMADIKLHVQLVQGLFESSVMRSRAAAALVGVSEKNAQNSLTLDTNAVIDHVLKRTRQLSEHILSQ
ncbi:hypothetical protein C9374_009886 [Naegleria lovaniensis]|uniref:Uncharacterized protein n=1 Tax=Naegleria lovaniensis TaxID=51637 RepID=A0AA88GHF9_NAELO|nr:uncharacterized protein C9374_009886 [Naegleria lovaniensis]KAG2375263.1 hypothetical protein C9374_009886 [Naegleria lovaniensis]